MAIVFALLSLVLFASIYLGMLNSILTLSRRPALATAAVREDSTSRKRR